MKHILRWHGCHLAVMTMAVSAVAAPPASQPTAKVRSKVFEIDYCVNEAAMPLDTVRLWYTQDKGATWQLYGQDPDCQSPIRFEAAQEGLYGFRCVVSNAAGGSGPEPQADADADAWAYVDYTPPVVQLRRPEAQASGAEQNVVAIRWAAIDRHLPPRPVSLAYKRAPDGPWQTIVAQLANTGRYDWQIPPDLDGAVVVRISVVDYGGNRVEAASTIELAPPLAPVDATPAASPAAPTTVAELVASAGEADEPPPTRARQLYEAAIGHRQRGQTRLAIARLRDALRLDPTLTPALVDLASLLYATSDYDASMQAYRLVLKQMPDSRSSLEGAARVSIAQRDFSQAGDYLRQILRTRPDDAETWLHLGDVAIYQGDEIAAREYYTKAATIDATAEEVVTRARMRLDDLPWLRERYQPSQGTSGPSGAAQP